jgi:uncharacterized protein (TIRG00374 family)
MAQSLSRKLLVGTVGLTLGLGCFWLATRNVELSEAKSIFESSDWRWIVVGICVFGTDIIIRIVRWRVILSHRRKIDFIQVARGLLVGYAVNILLPARLGELFRADYTARLSGVSRSTILGSIFIERVVDLFTVMSLFGIGLVLSGIKNSFIDNVVITGAIMLAVGVLLICLTVMRTTRREIRGLLVNITTKLLSDAVAKRAMRMISSFASLLRIVPTNRFLLVLALTVPIWALEGLSVFSICRAIGLNLTLSPSLVLLGGASLGTLFPTAPGFVGSYQFAFVVVLRNFSIPDSLALVAATGTQIYLMGVYALFGLSVWSFAPPTAQRSGKYDTQPETKVSGAGSRYSWLKDHV